MTNRYNHLNEYLKNKFGERVLKICIDGGFTCPNRDGSKGIGGCIFCGEAGAGENIKGKCQSVIESIENQVRIFLNSYRGERADKFIAYFQSFSNTYDTVSNLKLKYDTALMVSDKIIGLQIATRPDLVSEEVIDLLRAYSERYYVCVELGLQTADESIGQKLNRNYTTEEFVSACKRLKNNNIDVVGHMMIGLPGETEESIVNTVKIINENCTGIKIHSTYVQLNTELHRMYDRKEYLPITMDYYVRMVAKVISILDKSIIVHRINADPPKDQLIAPEWMLKKKIVLNAINKYLDSENIFQGCRSC